jgi:lipopolysaccharide export system permease protein
MRGGAPVAFGILQRYVVGEVSRAFLMALLTMTIIFVLFMVMAEAQNQGLSPREILALVPYVIPSTLPYTVPVSLLFSVTVVYGRLASDNEIVAVKAAGLSAMTVLWATFLTGAVLSVTLLYLSFDAIPSANHRAKLIVFANFEDLFYKTLKRDRELTNPKMPFLIKVYDVRDKTLIRAIFKHRTKGDNNPNSFDMIVEAKRAVIKFDMERGKARVYLEGGVITGAGKHEDVALINDKELEFDLPEKGNQAFEKRSLEMTYAEMTRGQAEYRRKIARERKRQAMAAALWIASGRMDRVDWLHVNEAFKDYGYWYQRIFEFETEKQLRVAQSFGSFFFVLLGAPVGILFARRDFLSAFISCFVPIILLYYPLMLLGVNMGKENILNPTLALSTGNIVLAVLAGFVLPPIIRH